MVKDGNVKGDLVGFFDDLQKSLAGIAKKHSVKVQPFQALMEEGALHLSLSATRQGAIQFYGEIWSEHREALGLPDYLEPGMSVIDPDTADQWTIIGLDPLYEVTPVRVMDEQMTHHWLSIERAVLLQPI